jgi:hypothetical protein
MDISKTYDIKSKEEPRLKQKLDRRDNIFVLLSFAVCFAFCELVLFGGFGIGVPLFFAVFYVIAAVYLSRGHNIANKSALLSFVPVLVLLLCFVIFDNSLLRALNVIALWLSATLNLLAMAGLESRPMFWAGTWYDILKTAFYTPLHNVHKRVSAFAGTFRSNTRRNVCIVLLTLLIISPVVIIVLVMLANSDAGFESLLDRLGSIFTARFWEYFFKIILSVVLTFPLFNLLYALQNEKRPENHPLEGFMLKFRCLEPLATASALSVFSLIYILYIAVQANYFFSAMLGILPASFTYAGYARRGFFELVTVVFINFCLIALSILITKRGLGGLAGGCRIPALVLLSCTLLLILTAASKMAMYMGNYGLTPLRVYTSWFMILLFVLTVFTMLKLISPSFDFYRFSAVGAIILYLGLNLANVDSLIAHYNISLYGQTGKLDTQVLYELSDSAVPEIAALKDDARYGTEIKEMLDARHKQLNSICWQDSTLAQIAERQADNADD